MSGLANLIRSKSTLIFSILVLIAGVLIGLNMELTTKNKLPELLRPVAVMPPKNIIRLDLVDHKKIPVNLTRLKDKWTFVFFGFTHCPDICPATLLQLRMINSTLKKEGVNNGKTQFFFVSVDPDRDSLEHLAGYIKYFDSEFIGMTGTEKTITDFEKQLGAFHRFEKKRADGNYNVAHSADVFLINSAAQLVAMFRPPMDTDDIVRQLAAFISLQAALG